MATTLCQKGLIRLFCGFTKKSCVQSPVLEWKMYICTGTHSFFLSVLIIKLTGDKHRAAVFSLFYNLAGGVDNVCAGVCVCVLAEFTFSTFSTQPIIKPRNHTALQRHRFKECCSTEEVVEYFTVTQHV